MTAKETLVPGLTHTRRVVVDRPRTIGFMGEEMRVYATPSMVSDMEYTCRDFLLSHVGDGQDSVGMRVEIDHLAPTLLGMEAEIKIEVTKIDGRKVTFAFEIADALETVGRGSHTRFIVDKAKTADRLAAKAAKVKS
jgi:predicted thioesterase